MPIGRTRISVGWMTRSTRNSCPRWNEPLLSRGKNHFYRNVTSILSWMLVALVQKDHGKNSGLQCYLRNMMAVMSFDADRRGRLISQMELNEYTHLLASAVTEAMHYFIGHCCYSPQDETRYLAVTAAHITHMLRDTFDDIQAGYFNIPREVLNTNRISPFDIDSKAYRSW